MSLDVILKIRGERAKSRSGIFIRENGQTKEISEIEWSEKFPDRKPFRVINKSEDEVYAANITHNLNKMANAAGIYEALWRPEEIGIYSANDLIKPLTLGLVILLDNPGKFKKQNPTNGWGDYEGLINFVYDYLKACKKFPGAEIYVNR